MIEQGWQMYSVSVQIDSNGDIQIAGEIDGGGGVPTILLSVDQIDPLIVMLKKAQAAVEKMRKATP